MDNEVVKELTDEELKEVSGGFGPGYVAVPFTPLGCFGQVTAYVKFRGRTCYKYVVAFGDTYSQVAVSLADGDYNRLAEFNRKANPNILNVGDVIYVPYGSYQPNAKG